MPIHKVFFQMCIKRAEPFLDEISSLIATSRYAKKENEEFVFHYGVFLKRKACAFSNKSTKKKS